MVLFSLLFLLLFLLSSTQATHQTSLSSLRSAGSLLVTTLDGSIHSLNKETGVTLWTWASGNPLLSTTEATTEAPLSNSPLLPLLNDKDHPSHLSDLSTSEAPATSNIAYIPEPAADGSIFMYRPGTNEKIEKLKLPIKDLVKKTPFWTDDGTVYLGSKTTTFYALDSVTGNLLESYGDNGTVCERGTNKVVTGNTIFLGRTDYKLSIRDRAGGRRWVITYGEFTSDDLDVPRPSTLTFETPFVTSKGGGGGVASNILYESWRAEFTTPAIAVFDVFKSPSKTGLIVSRQPRDPSLGSVAVEHSAPKTSMTAYVGQLNGQLYALSSEHFPLVPLSSLKNRPLINGNKRPSSSDLESSLYEGHEELHPDVDDFAFAPRPTCHQGDASYPDCLVGNHVVVRDVMHTIEYQTADETDLNIGAGNPSTPESKRRRRFLTLPAPVAKAAMTAMSSDGYLGILLRSATLLCVMGLSVYVGRRYRSTPGHGALRTGRRRRRGVPPGKSQPESSEGEQKVETVQANGRKGEEREAEGGGPLLRPANRRRGGRKKNAKNDGEPDSDLRTSDGGDNKKVEQANITPCEATSTMANDLTTTTTKAPQLLTLTSTVLGYGSHGTVVYKGRFEDRDVAVKRLLLDFYDIAETEVRLLRESDDHPHVVRYFCKEKCDRFMYIALELCHSSLHDLIERPAEHSDLAHHLPPAKILYQIASGLHHLHSLKIVHRDIKPQNILVCPGRDDVGAHRGPSGMATARTHSTHGGHRRSARILISDFGLCKRLEYDESSFNNLTHAAVNGSAGTIGWRAPECLVSPSFGAQTSSSTVANDKKLHRITRAIDVFSAGCLFYYVLSGGDHPFGDRYDREAKVLKGEYDLRKLEILGTEGVEARDLIEKMIQKDPKSRPKTGAILNHPYFWPPSRRLAFLQDASDRLETEIRDPPSPLLVELERSSKTVLGCSDWTQRVDRCLSEHLGRHRGYRGASVRDLLRAMRNKRHHYGDLPDSSKRLLGSVPEGFEAYFSTRFPRLLLHVFQILGEDERLRTEPLFQPYFGETGEF